MQKVQYIGKGATKVFQLIILCFVFVEFAHIEPEQEALLLQRNRDALRQLKYYGRFLTELLTRSSANPEEPCEHTVS